MEIAALILSTITAGVSALAAVLAVFLAKKTAEGDIEIQIRTMISDARYRCSEVGMKLAADGTNLQLLQALEATAEEEVLNAYDEACAKYIDRKVNADGTNLQLLQALEATAEEEVLNAYDEACAKYIDRKVNKVRFKKMYSNEIKQVVEDKNFTEKYDPTNSKYEATLKVYNEWRR